MAADCEARSRGNQSELRSSLCVVLIQEHWQVRDSSGGKAHFILLAAMFVVLEQFVFLSLRMAGNVGVLAIAATKLYRFAFSADIVAIMSLSSNACWSKEQVRLQHGQRIVLDGPRFTSSGGMELGRIIA